MSEAAGGNKAPSNVGKELRKSRQLLMDIEKVIGVLYLVLRGFTHVYCSHIVIGKSKK